MKTGLRALLQTQTKRVKLNVILIMRSPSYYGTRQIVLYKYTSLLHENVIRFIRYHNNYTPGTEASEELFEEF